METAYEAGFNPEEDPEDPAVRQLWLDLASGAESGEACHKLLRAASCVYLCQLCVPILRLSLLASFVLGYAVLSHYPTHSHTHRPVNCCHACFHAGWDYSSRWFEDGFNLTTIRTTSIIPAGRCLVSCDACCMYMQRSLRLASGTGTQLPFANLMICKPNVDLNAYLLQVEGNIADFAAELGCTEVEQRFRELAADRWAVRRVGRQCWTSWVQQEQSQPSSGVPTRSTDDLAAASANVCCAVAAAVLGHHQLWSVCVWLQAGSNQRPVLQQWHRPMA